MKPKIDPELSRQLAQMSARDETLEVVVSLRAGQPGVEFPSPEETETVTQQVLRRVAGEVGDKPQAVNVFRNLGSFVVVAREPFVRKLLQQAEVRSATANQQAEDPMIHPQRRKPE